MPFSRPPPPSGYFSLHQAKCPSCPWVSGRNKTLKYYEELSNLTLRIIGNGLQLIITAYFFALGLAYIESFAQRNTIEDDDKEQQKRSNRHWSENALALFTCVVATCSFLIISINLINGLFTKIGNPQFLIMKVFGRMVNHQYMSRPEQTAYFTSLKLPIQKCPGPPGPLL